MKPPHLLSLARRLIETQAHAAIVSGEVPPAFTVERHANGHAAQLALMRDRATRILVMCARQVGKSWGIAGILLDNALNKPKSTNVFLGLNGPAARMNFWEPVWLPLLDRWRIRRNDNVSRMVTTFPNGARVVIGGTDDLRHISNILGNRLADGVFALDEAQDQSSSVLRILLKSILPPMLTPTSRLILSGVIPETPAGTFWDEKQRGTWSEHGWGRWANVHTPEARQQLADHLRDNHLTEDDPQIQRDWFGRAVFDANATAYRYRPDRNGYIPIEPAWLPLAREQLLSLGIPIESLRAAVPMLGVCAYSIGYDPGGGDRSAMVAWGWGTQSNDIQQVFEWTTPRDAHASQGQFAEVGRIVQQHYGTPLWHYDAGSGTTEIDNLQIDYGIPVIKAAAKSDARGQIRRNNDLLLKGYVKAMIGGALERDYQRARRDPGSTGGDAWKWASSWHPDASEAGRYGLQGYSSMYVAPPPVLSMAARDQGRHPDPATWEQPQGPHDPMSEAIGRAMGEDVRW